MTPPKCSKCNDHIGTHWFTIGQEFFMVCGECLKEWLKPEDTTHKTMDTLRLEWIQQYYPVSVLKELIKDDSLAKSHIINNEPDPSTYHNLEGADKISKDDSLPPA